MDLLDSRLAPEVARQRPSAATTTQSRRLSDQILAFADSNRYKLFAVLLVLYALGFNGKWRLEPDSALYLNLGRNLAEGQGYTYHGERQQLAFPGPPLLFAATFRLFGSQTLVPPLVLMLLIGLATLALTYQLFYLHSGRPTAVLITFGVGISRLFYRYCFELLSDMPFLLGVMAFLAGYEAIFHRSCESANRARAGRWYNWLLMVLGLAIAATMRPAMWGLLIAIILALVWSALHGQARRRQIIAAAVVLAIGVLFWALDLRRGPNHALGQYEDALFQIKLMHLGALFHQSIHEYIPRLFEATLSQTMFGCRMGPGANTLVGIAALTCAAVFLRDRPLWLIWVAMTVAMVLVAVKPLDRYFLEVLPLLVWAWWSGLRWLNHRLPSATGNWIFFLLFGLGGLTNLVKVSEIITTQQSRPFLESYELGRFASIQEVADLLHQNVLPDGWVLAPAKTSRILSFLSRRWAIEPNPHIRIDPTRQPLFVLQPLNDSMQQWLAGCGAQLGEPVGPAISGRFDPQPWRLYRARAVAPPP